ncbi:uncharacterized protein LOC134227557 [Armigeres subalbatus]|uniref:uncharacterized protein LOC134227557 n=1 Tax=Armigeres subalbatus TaxID=124917 RepID=UPI002ED4E8D0
MDVSRFSNWHRLLRAAAYILRAVQRFKGKKALQTTFLVKKELVEAEMLIWRQVQAESYPDECTILWRNLTEPSKAITIPKSSPLYRLSAFIDESGVVRMNSRIAAQPTVSYNTKYPILLPRKHPAVYLLTESYHRRYQHGNGESVCNKMRQRFHVPGLRVLIRRVSKQCLTCRVKKGVPHPHMMAALPETRVTGTIKPFTHTGVDYFGPILVKQGRCLVKRWVALFTCLTVRAVHLEIVHSLSTQSCVMAIRRCVARRGFPETFYSDNGTNFLGASNLLAKQIQDTHENYAVAFTNTNTSWIFNPPFNPYLSK